MGVRRMSVWAAMAAASIAAGVLEPARTQSPAGGVRLEVAPGTTATYRIREQLARLNFPNDAVGTTPSVSGAIVLRTDGSFGAESKLTVDLRTIKSDSERRDGFVRQNTLETDKYPLADFVPRRQKGMPATLPSSGVATFQLIGDLTLHGVTSEVSWDVSASFGVDAVSAKATTRFNFARFKITIPKVLGLLSVDDDIRLELDAKLRRAVG